VTSLATPTSIRSSPPPSPGARPPRNAGRSTKRACELRRPGAPLADLRAALEQEGSDVSESDRFRVLRRAGLTATRHQRSTRQPGTHAKDGSVVPEVADVRALSLEDGRQFPTQVAGLFLFLPVLLDLDPGPALTNLLIQ
jgi:hypothetical protein